MSRTLVVEVGNGDIIRSRMTQKKNCSTCPIALSVQRKYGLKCGVSRSGMYVEGYGRVSFPPHVTRWIDRHDAGFASSPLTFSVRLEKVT